MVAAIVVLLLLTLIAEEAWSCKITVSDTVEFDLSPLENTESHYWTDSATGTSYEATVCNSARLLPSRCSLNNAVAIESGTCIAYGTYDALQLTDFLDERRYQDGLMLSYGNGVSCHSSTSGKGSAIFMIECDRTVSRQSDMLYKVYINSKYIFKYLYDIMEGIQSALFYVYLLV